MPRLTILIVTYQSLREIDACLHSLVAFPMAVPHEIVVVDNASADGTAAHVRREWPQVRVIDAGGNLGFARANNLGVGQTASDLVLFLNPDTIVPAGALDRLVAALDAAPDAAIAGPRVVDARGDVELSFGRMLSPLAEARQKMMTAALVRRLPVLGARVERATRRRQYVDWVSGVCLLIRRADLQAAGGFDERYFIYIEDVDLCAAVRTRARLVLFEPSVEIVHLRGRSVASAQTPTRRAYRRSQVSFYRKHRPGWVTALKWFLTLKGEWPDQSFPQG